MLAVGTPRTLANPFAVEFAARGDAFGHGLSPVAKTTPDVFIRSGQLPTWVFALRSRRANEPALLRYVNPLVRDVFGL